MEEGNSESEFYFATDICNLQAIEF
jgi:hypothetical protein